jgi:hypothetical protein
VDVSLSTAPAAATRATTSCISSWVRSAWRWHTSWARLQPKDSRVCSKQNWDNWRSPRRLQNRKVNP